jgi:hypothetical protein
MLASSCFKKPIRGFVLGRFLTETSHFPAENALGTLPSQSLTPKVTLFGQTLARFVALIGLCLFTTASSYAEPRAYDLDVFKSETCGCCVGWIDHLEANGFNTAIHHPPNMSAVKERYDISTRYRSCHTGVSKDGFVFEGHVPAKFVKRFLANPPANAIGLAVPGMPVGSPGMEVEDKFMAYEVLVINRDGTSEVFAFVSNAAEQHE